MADLSCAAPAVGLERPRVPRSVLTRLLGAATAAALGVDSYVHARDAGFYDAVQTSVLSQGTLFRLEAAVAGVIAVALLIRPSRIWFAAAFLVAASALGAVLLYTYVDVGSLGPLPNMYEPTWALPGKPASAWAEGAGVVLAATGLLTTWRARALRPAPADGGRPSERPQPPARR